MILDGKKVSNEIIEKAKKEVIENNLKINFAIIWVGNDEASSIYVNNKIKKCKYVGINPILYHLEESTTEDELLDLIDDLNKDTIINGILLQSPVPKHIDIKKCFDLIDETKDIDGFSYKSVGKLVLGNDAFISCTPQGIMELLSYYNIDVSGKNVVIINRSNIVGKPLMYLLVRNDATVTVCHSKTADIASHTQKADIVISAVGNPKFITADMIKKDAILIDVGISRVDGHVVGDVDYESVKDKCSYITPVPGGVGPMTIACVIKNLMKTKEER